MRVYFFTFIGVSIFLFLIVMSQIKVAISETQKEQDAWLTVQIP